LKTYDQAKAYVETIGARLPTFEEMVKYIDTNGEIYRGKSNLAPKKKSSAACNAYVDLNSANNFEHCLNKAKQDSRCASGSGYFNFDANTNNWCACCTNASEALTKTSASETCDIY